MPPCSCHKLFSFSFSRGRAVTFPARKQYPIHALHTFVFHTGWRSRHPFGAEPLRTDYLTSSSPRTSDFISTYNWTARRIGRCTLYLEARLLWWRWRERREHDPSCQCQCVSHLHVSSVCKTKLMLTTAGVDNVGKEGKQSLFVADISETDCHDARNCRRVF